MNDIQQRVTNERDQLEKKLRSLTIFMDGVKFESLPYEERKMLQIQRPIMESYCEILNFRIANFD